MTKCVVGCVETWSVTENCLSNSTKYMPEMKEERCEYFRKGFCKLHRLSDHINFHTGEKPHYCKFCNTNFASFRTKAVHERSQMDLKRKK